MEWGKYYEWQSTSKFVVVLLESKNYMAQTFYPFVRAYEGLEEEIRMFMT